MRYLIDIKVLDVVDNNEDVPYHASKNPRTGLVLLKLVEGEMLPEVNALCFRSLGGNPDTIAA